MSCFDYKIGVPTPGTYQEVFNSDAVQFGGSGQVNDADHFSIPAKMAHIITAYKNKSTTFSNHYF